MIATIKGKILVGSGLLILIGFTVLAGANIYNSYRNAESAVLEHARLLAGSEAGRVQRMLGKTYDSAQAMAEAAVGVKAALPANGRALLSEVVKRQLPNNPDAVGYWVDWEPNAFDGRDAELAGKPENDHTGRYGVYWFRKAGKVDVVWGSDGVDESAYYTEPRKTGKPMLTEPYVDPDVKILMGTLSFPLNIGGKVLGVAGCDIALGHLQEMAAKVRPYDAGFMSLYSNGGVQLAGRQPGLNGKPAPDLPAEAKAAIKDGRPAEYRSDDGFRHFIMPIVVGEAGTPWAVRISIPEDEAFAPVRAASWQSALISLGILALILLLLGTTLNQLLRPLGRLQGAMTELASGSGDLTRELSIASRDEIGQAAGAFNTFTGSLRRMMLDVRGHAGDMLGSVRQLTGDVGQIRDSSARQSQAANATAASVEQLSVSVTHIAESARVAEQRAREADALSSQAAANVDATAAEIGRIAHTVRQLADVLGGMQQRSDRISGIVSVIRDIADQTNLLALNAAIEAARAGEQGRGFAVVADEVRKLAERTAQATLEISDVIQTMQKDTSHAADSMSGALEQVEQGVKLAGESSQSIQQISGQAQQVVHAVGDIAVSTAEQSSASQEIARHIENIHGMLLQTDDSIHQAQQATVALARLGEELESLIGRFKL
ncbi:methyl-accepting chemotaxis protein [Chromobacterium violaceum]|uniref:Methyl-accepting chemotaxis protein II n=1 Tax=Chromobacterium violaceum (strain ATCC 12472 / DSM 30191 / JCM 1249 / CCUG 213 / NBRC 12614 / NCIMB 9131 / NCTC 9757 / MK) TaxID=243365 RepID=Q7P230_CHRVO|nr:methyl-accepting chemotaxis protein [Chromobacterium violaceum]AAQ57711.1 methyl-accepting chemotaxis protein II [Chromobacterium violaceum ATCC 12472]SUX40694.1 H1 [Chromobacterium violaceum]